MVFQWIPDFPRIPVHFLSNPPPPGFGPFAILTQERDDEATLLSLAQLHGSNLVLPEVWSRLFPQTGVLISSAISGGVLKQRFQEAVQKYPNRCWLLPDPISMEFPLPCPDGSGYEIAVQNYINQFFSEDLGCMYTHQIRDNRGFMILWDTVETMLQKQEWAKQAGFLGTADLS